MLFSFVLSIWFSRICFIFAFTYNMRWTVNGMMYRNRCEYTLPIYVSITSGWHISYTVGLFNVFWHWRPTGLDDTLRLGPSERHLSDVCWSAWSLSSFRELAAADGEMLGVRPPVRSWDMSEPRRLVIFLKPTPEQKHLHMIRLNANRKSFEKSA